jgi:hypothetical protein
MVGLHLINIYGLLLHLLVMVVLGMEGHIHSSAYDWMEYDTTKQ